MPSEIQNSSQNDPKIKSKSQVRIEWTIENKSCLTIWVDPKTVFELYPNFKNCPLGSQGVKNYPKIKYKAKVRNRENIENKSCSATCVDPKTVLNPTPTP